MTRQRLQFSVTSTSAAKKSQKISSALKSQFKRAAKLVFQTDIPDLHKFYLSVIALSDDELLAINRTSLDHDYYTDIITFEIERDDISLEAEIYISIDRARENAKKYRVSTEEELIRLVVHGALHLAGYSDKTSSSKNQMRRRERWYLTRIRP